VTLVWKSNFDPVSQYGVSFKYVAFNSFLLSLDWFPDTCFYDRSKAFGNERFKPRHGTPSHRSSQKKNTDISANANLPSYSAVVRAPEEASSRENAYDYVILCVKALPDVYDLAAVIESVVTPQHTCILVNTTNSIGVESHLEQRFPTNVILSLVSGVEISQIGASEFEHLSSSKIWVGATSKQSNIPSSIQNDMASALAMTLSSGGVDCKVSDNIRQEQFERMIGYVPLAIPISAFLSTNICWQSYCFPTCKRSF